LRTDETLEVCVIQNIEQIDADFDVTGRVVPCAIEEARRLEHLGDPEIAAREAWSVAGVFASGWTGG
jgi:hypothetical protein